MTTQQDIERIVAEAAERLPKGTVVNLRYEIAPWSDGRPWAGHAIELAAKIAGYANAAHPEDAMTSAVANFLANQADADRAYAAICGEAA